LAWARQHELAKCIEQNTQVVHIVHLRDMYTEQKPVIDKKLLHEPNDSKHKWDGPCTGNHDIDLGYMASILREKTSHTQKTSSQTFSDTNLLGHAPRPYSPGGEY